VITKNFWINDDTGITWESISALKIKDFLTDDAILKDDNTIRELLCSNLSNEKMLAVKLAIRDSVKYVNKSRINLEFTDPDIRAFLLRFQKGSKPIQKIFETYRNSKIKLRNLGKTSTFFRLISSQKPEEEMCADLYSEWSNQCYPIKIREFILKFRSNILGINTRVSHFNNNISRGCTFCTLKKTADITGRVQMPGAGARTCTSAGTKSTVKWRFPAY
jgi:hypothetical protein